MRFSHFFVDRPIFAAVISIVITLIGGIAYYGLPVAQYPEVAPPTVVVSASYPGASAEVVAETVATPLEQQINGVEDMLYMVSQSTGDGRRPDHHHLRARHRPRRGAGAGPEPGLDRRAAAARGGAPARHHDQEELARPDDGDPSQLAGRVARPALHLQLRHAADQGRAGPPARRRRHPGVRRARLLDAHLAQPRPDGRARSHRRPTWSTRSRGQNIQVASGGLNQLPVPDPGAFQLSIETLGRLQDVRQFENIIVKTDPDGRITRVRDVARVELGAQDYLRNAYLDGVPPRPWASSSSRARTRWRPPTEVGGPWRSSGKASRPASTTTSSTTRPSSSSSRSTRWSRPIFEAVALVVVVVILFLQTWRAAIIPIVAIPVSLIGTFAVMAALGFSLNNLSLFGLVLAIGIVVDDAIVVVENVERNLREGSRRGGRAQDAWTRSAVPCSRSRWCSAVFIPAALIAGIQGQFYRQFAVTIAASTLISCLVSLTLSPALCALLLKPHEEHPKRSPLADRPDPLVLQRLQLALRPAVARLRRRSPAGWSGSACCARRLRRADRARRPTSSSARPPASSPSRTRAT